MHRGWIKTFRKILEWEWYDDVNTKVLFIHLLLTVNYESKNWHGQNINAGQIITSYSKLSEQLKLSEMQIRTSLNKLKVTGDITVKTTNRYSMITVNNWFQYQEDNTQDNTQITRNLTLKQHSDNTQITTTKEVKNIRIKEEESILCDFKIFWESYPRKTDRKKSLEKYTKHRKDGKTQEEIMTGLQKYKMQIRNNGTETQYIKHPTTWLNGECWNDEIKRDVIAMRKATGLI